MAMEIERKFLVGDVPAGLAIDSEEEIAQGYLAVGADEIRLRLRAGRHLLTAKQGHGLAREEVEVALDPAAFEALWPLTEGRRVEKTRSTTQIEGGTLEIDVYTGALAGLVTAEIEFDDSESAAAFTPPSWLLRELTGDERYSNQRLAQDGLP